MTTKELREKSTADLYKLLEQQSAKLFKLRLQRSSDQLSTTHLFSLTKRLIARINTLINEKSRAVN